MLNCKRPNQTGVTLVEVMISVLVFVIGITAMLDVCTQGVLMSRKADAAYTAYNLAKNRIETLKAVAFSELASAEETSTLLDEAGVPDLKGSFTRGTAITPSYLGNPDLTEVDVTVYYKVRGQQSSNPMRMTTLIYDNEEEDD